MRDFMETEEIRQAVRATIEAIVPEADFARLRPELPLREQVDLDSMDWLNVVVALHEKLAIAIPESDYDRLPTLDAIVSYAASRLAGQAGEQPPVAAEPGRLPSSTHRVRGTSVRVRPMRREDLPMEADFILHLSSDARYRRFMLTLRFCFKKASEFLAKLVILGRSPQTVNDCRTTPCLHLARRPKMRSYLREQACV